MLCVTCFLSLEPTESFVQVFLPFRSNPVLREEYISPQGRIRVGKALEDLDALAGSVSYLHCSDADRELTIVTASVDRIDLIRDIPVDRDISIVGQVTYVGSSSMEVSIRMMRLPDEKLSRTAILEAKFIMVARDPATGKAATVPQLLLETDEDRARFRAGTEHKARKQFAAQTALTKRAPSVEEMSLVHSLYLEYRQYAHQRDDNPMETAQSIVPKPHSIEFMGDTRLQNITLTFPQDRNMHGKIFGGWLMRLAFELGYATGSLFAQAPLHFLSLDDITFRRPVEIGAILDLSSQVCYTMDKKIVVKVVAHVLEPESGSKELSNEFWFTFEAAPKNVSLYEPRRIMPRSYNDCMLYIEGRRRIVST
ncbi:Thioesterase/thiol ester dehydrase-isomerase [Chytriomyces sp. MP71]|nr:Thioesterase/thiol ester dehydrase-isomerase [Chytriomyces sp. MP71]